MVAEARALLRTGQADRRDIGRYIHRTVVRHVLTAPLFHIRDAHATFEEILSHCSYTRISRDGIRQASPYRTSVRVSFDLPESPNQLLHAGPLPPRSRRSIAPRATGCA